MQTNEPAFPTDAQSALKHDHYEGMSLRDYFAIHAPIPFDDEASPKVVAKWVEVEEPGIMNEKEWGDWWNMVNAKARYSFADAMLQSRDPK